MKENIRYYNLSMSIREIVHLIESNNIELDTSMYRNLVWNTQRQSLFIDSLYSNFPTPNIFLYVNEKNENVYSVIDGIQRLKTIHRFITNDLRIHLKDSYIHQLTFDDLPPSEKKRLLNSSIPITVVEDMWNDDKVIEEIFYRLNLGGTNLTHQEFRNRMFKGEMINTINDLNYYSSLWRILYNKPIDPRYRDSEEILKFFTLVHAAFSEDKNNHKSIKEQMDEFVHLNRYNADLARKLGNTFERALNVIYVEFGEQAFLKNKRFNQKLYMMLCIPLGILITQGVESFNFSRFHNMLSSDKSENSLKLPNHMAVSIGLDMLAGDNHE